MQDWAKAILTNGPLWSAFLLLCNTVLFYLWPDFPREINTAVNAFIIALLAVFGINATRQTVASVRALRAQREVEREWAGIPKR